MSNTLNILYFLPTFGTGGSERVVLDLTRLLDHRGFACLVCVLKSGELEPSLSARGGELYNLSIGLQPPSLSAAKLKNLLIRLMRLKRFIEKRSIDLIHTHHLSSLLHTFLALRLTKGKIKWIHTEHNRPDLDYTYPRTMVRITKPLLRYPDALTGISDYVSDYFTGVCRIPASKVLTIPNGVKIQHFNTSKDRLSIMQKLGFSTSDILLGSIGNLRKEKNHQLLVRAFHLLNSRVPQTRLVLCGDGECRSELEMLTERLNITSRVSFLGFRLDIAEILSVLDLFCLPSSYEGMPVSLLEAWATRRPVVATNVPGIRNLVRHGHNGILVTSNNPEELAESLYMVLKNEGLRNKISRNGHALVSKDFSVENTVAKYTDLYLKLMVQ